MSKWAVKTENLTKKFGKLVAVDNLNLKVAKGEIYGLVGPDGAGKTTTMRLLTSILNPTAGTIKVAGYDVLHNPAEVWKRIGYMAQQFNLYGDLTVLENLYFFADIFGIPKAERDVQIKELLAFSGLTKFARRQAQYLSGGMQKKLALACTLIHEPEVLFLDEPTTGVDPVSRREFWEILVRLHTTKKITILVSTPYMDEAERCNWIGLMYNGKLLTSESPGKIKEKVEAEIVELEAKPGIAARKVALKMSFIKEVEVFGNKLHLEILDYDKIPILVSELEKKGVIVGDVRKVKPSMEDAFVILMRKQSEQVG